MTQPVQEPNPNRDLSGLGWGERQLARRPAPVSGGTFSVPCFRAYLYNASGPTVSDNDQGYLIFDRWQTSDSAVITSGGWIAGSPDRIVEVDILERGLYAFTIQLDFNATFNPGDEIYLAIEDAGSTYTGPPMVGQVAQSKGGDGTTGLWSWTHIQSFPPIWVNDTGGANANAGQGPDLPQVKMALFNLTGSSITVSEAYLEIHQIWAFDYDTLRANDANHGAIQAQA